MSKSSTMLPAATISRAATTILQQFKDTTTETTLTTSPKTMQSAASQDPKSLTKLVPAETFQLDTSWLKEEAPSNIFCWVWSTSNGAAMCQSMTVVMILSRTIKRIRLWNDRLFSNHQQQQCSDLKAQRRKHQATTPHAYKPLTNKFPFETSQLEMFWLKDLAWENIKGCDRKKAMVVPHWSRSWE